MVPEAGSKKFPLRSVKLLEKWCLSRLPPRSLSATGGGAEPAGDGRGGEGGQSRPEPGTGKGGFLWGGVADLVPVSWIPLPCCARRVPSITWHPWSQEEMDELCDPAEARSQPSYHHGNGPYNDVNIPGCWFFKLPHKASWVLRGPASPCLATPRPSFSGPVSPYLSPLCCATPGTPMVLCRGTGWWKRVSAAGTGGWAELY